MRRRRLITTLCTGLLGGVAGCRADSQQPTPAFAARSPAFESGGMLPARFTCDDIGASPPLAFDRVPAPTAALAVVATADAGAITDATFWTLWNVPPETDRVPAGLPREPTLPSLAGARQGRRGGELPGYKPPCPPAGTPIRHRFQLYALDERLAVAGGATHEAATEAIEAAELASTRLTVSYAGSETTTDAGG